MVNATSATSQDENGSLSSAPNFPPTAWLNPISGGTAVISRPLKLFIQPVFDGHFH